MGKVLLRNARRADQPGLKPPLFPVRSNDSPFNDLPVTDSSANLTSTGRRAVAAIWLPVVYFCLAVWSTWPLASSITVALPQGTESAATVPLFNLWTLWWNADRAAAAYSGYWNAPIFWPAKNAFAFSEPQLPTVAVAPLVWGSETPVLAYNVYLLLSLTLNGWAAYRLFRRLDLSAAVAFSGGAMLLLLPFVHWQLGVLQLVPLYGILWTIHACWNFGSEPTVRRGLAIGVSLAWTYLLCAYYGLFLVLLLIPGFPWLFGQNLWNRRAWLKLLPGAAACLVILLPVLAAQRAAIQEPDFERKPVVIRSLSAEPGDYTVPAWPEILQLPDRSNDERRPYWPLSSGNLKWLLASIGAAGGVFIRGRRRWIGFCVTFGAAAFLLSQGTKLQLCGITPYESLIGHIPGMAQVRNVFRFAVFVQISAVLAAVVGLDLVAPHRLISVWNRMRGSRGRSSAADLPPGAGPLRRTVVGPAVLFFLGCAAALEIRPPSQPLYPMPSVAQSSGWIGWLNAHTRAGDVVACVPFPEGRRVEDYQETTVSMYWQTFHHRRMVNGYSGYFPAAYRRLRDLMRGFPRNPALKDEALNELRAMGVHFCVVRHGTASRTEIESAFPGRSRLLWQFSDESARVDIYRVDP